MSGGTLVLFICCYLVAGSYGRAYSRAEVDDEIEKGCGNNPADITFVLDASSSIWGPHFKLQLTFVENVVRMFDVGVYGTHIGLMTFADRPTIHFDMDKYNTQAQLLTHISRSQQDTGGTATDKAIKAMRTEMFSVQHSRPFVPHIGILITDGKSGDVSQTAKEAALARDQGITMFAIGVGQEIYMTELQNTASQPYSSYLSTAANYIALDNLKTKLAWSACQVTTLPPRTTTTTTTTTTTSTTSPAPTKPPIIEGCNNRYPMDIMFSIPDQTGIEGAKYSVEFIESIVGDTVLSPIQVQVGVTPRFCDRRNSIYLNQHNTWQGLADVLQKRVYKNCRTEKHIHYMYTEGMAPENGAREQAAKFGILIIDNKSRNSEETIKQAKIARDQGIDLIVIGVGDNVDSTELKALAGKHNTPFSVDDYSQLQSLTHRITDGMCLRLNKYIK